MALGWVNLVLKDDPNSIPALLMKGRVLHRLGKTEEALRVIEGVLKVEPKHISAWYNKACYRCMLGHDYKKVLKDLGRALKRAPFLKILAKQDEDFKRIWEKPEFKELTATPG